MADNDTSAETEDKPVPCSYCGSTDGYSDEYDGWPRCVVCHGC